MQKYAVNQPTNAIMVNGKAYPRRTPLYLTECPSVQKTGVAAGSLQQFRLPNVTEKDQILSAACKRGGIPVIVGILLTVEQTITEPVIAGSTSDPLIASFMERRAEDTIYLQPGKAAQYYQMTRTEDRVSDFVHRMNFIAPDACAAMLQQCADTSVSSPRTRVDDGEGVSAALDYTSAERYRGQPGLDMPPMRVVYPGSLAAPVSEPASGTAFCDAIPIPLTADGPVQPGDAGSGLGCEDAGILHGDLFDTGNEWDVFYTPQNNTDLYRQRAGEVPTFGTFTIRFYVLWRVAPVALDANGNPTERPKLGRVWKWNNNVAQVQSGNSFVDISAEAVRGAFLYGWFQRVFSPAAGIARVFCEADTSPGAGNEYRPQIAFIPPSFSPASCLYTLQSYLEIASEGGAVEFPDDGQQNHRGVEWLQRWNSIFNERTRWQYFASREAWMELPMFPTGDQRIATVSRFCAFTCQYGVTYAGGVAFATLPSDPGMGPPTSSVQRTIGMAGLPVYPLGYDLPWAKGFPGYATRGYGSGDDRALRFTAKGSWVFPSLPDGTAWPVESLHAGPAYSDINVAADCCAPCSQNVTTQPLPANASSPNAPMGDVLSTARIATPGFTAALVQNR